MAFSMGRFNQHVETSIKWTPITKSMYIEPHVKIVENNNIIIIDFIKN